MTDAPTYTIGTVLDFLQVPEDRREVCVKEFLCWLVLTENVPKIMEGIPIDVPTEFIWIDDNLHTIDFTISSGVDEIRVISGRIRGFGG